MSSLELTHDKLITLWAYEMGYGRQQYSTLTPSQRGVMDQLKDSAYRLFLYPDPLPGKRARHRWSFLWPETTLTLSAAYTTGTVTIVNGVVTGSGTVFPSWAAQGEITPDAGSTYSVDTRDSDTQLTLDDTSSAADVSAGTSYSLGRVEYDMPTDFGGIQDGMTYRPEASTAYDPIEFTSWGIIRRLRQLNGSATMRPKRACLLAKSHDETAVQGYKIVFDYQSDSAYVLNYRYAVNADALDATNKYMVGGVKHSETLLAAGMYVAARLRGADSAKISEARDFYMSRLISSVAEDESMIPETVGLMRDDSDDRAGRRYSRHNDIGVYPKFEGSVYY